jgi:hypothetical protein
MSDLKDLFKPNSQLNLSGSSSNESDDEKGGIQEVMYRPRPHDAKDRVYKSRIRFVPWYKDPSKWFIRKYIYYNIRDEEEGPIRWEGKYDETAGRSKEEDNLVRKMWQKLYNLKDKDPMQAKKADFFKRSGEPQHFMLVQIIDDKVYPELNGKIRVMQLNQHIWKQVRDLRWNDDEDERMLPTNLLEAKEFNIKVENPTDDPIKNDYTACGFVSKVTPIAVPNENNEFEYDENGKLIRISNTEEDLQRVKEYLERESPDFEQFEYQPPSEETIENLKAFIRKHVEEKYYKDIIGKEYSSSKPKSKSSDEDDEDELDRISKSSSTDNKSFPDNLEGEDSSTGSNKSSGGNSEDDFDDILDDL